MPTLAQGQSVTLQMSEGESWTVTPTGQAQISTRGVSGGPLQAPTTIATATTFGPYTEPGTLTIFAMTGAAAYSGSEMASLVSGAGNTSATTFPDEAIRVTSSNGVCGAPCYISRIVCVSGTGVSLTVHEGAASTATTLLTATLSAGQEATIPGGRLRAINGVRAVFASGSFDFYIGTEQ